MKLKTTHSIGFVQITDNNTEED